MLAEAGVAAARSFAVTVPGISAIDPWMEDVGSEWRDLAEDVLFRARVCVAEIAANVLEHGCVHPGRDEVRVALHRVGAAIEIEISDTGCKFDPTRPPPCPVEPDAVGGRGLRLVHAYASAMSYRREGERNLLVLRVAPVRRLLPG
jgi:anti-sigma regulatory factor (Ser/Thr protein kinase)